MAGGDQDRRARPLLALDHGTHAQAGVDGADAHLPPIPGLGSHRNAHEREHGQGQRAVLPRAFGSPASHAYHRAASSQGEHGMPSIYHGQ